MWCLLVCQVIKLKCEKWPWIIKYNAFFRGQGCCEWYHCCTPEKGIGSFLGEMSGAVHNVSVDSRVTLIRLTDINVCCIIAHRSPPVDQQNSASTVETDQPEHPVVGTKRARMMPGSKIVLPSSDVEEYIGVALRSIVSCIVNPKGMILFSYKLFDFFVGRTGSRYIYYSSDNRPSWWPKDVAFSRMTGT